MTRAEFKTVVINSLSQLVLGTRDPGGANEVFDHTVQAILQAWDRREEPTTKVVDARATMNLGEQVFPDLFPDHEAVDHPAHYGGGDNPYEVIKVIRAWGMGFSLGNAVKYIARAGKKDPAKTLEDLRKARWYIDEEIQHLEKGQ